MKKEKKKMKTKKAKKKNWFSVRSAMVSGGIADIMCLKFL